MKWMGSGATWHKYPFIGVKDIIVNAAVGGVVIRFVTIFVGTYRDGCMDIIALSTCYKLRVLRSRVL